MSLLLLYIIHYIPPSGIRAFKDFIFFGSTFIKNLQLTIYDSTNFVTIAAATVSYFIHIQTGIDEFIQVVFLKTVAVIFWSKDHNNISRSVISGLMLCMYITHEVL